MEGLDLEQAFGDIAMEDYPQEVAQDTLSDDMVDIQPQQQAQAEPQIAEPQGFDPSAMSKQMESQSNAITELARSIASMNEPKVVEPQYEPTEEDIIRERARKELGLEDLDNKLKAQEEALKQQNQYIEMMKKQDEVRQREQEFMSMEKEFGSIDREAIQNKLIEISRSNPQLAEALNSPEGVRMLVKQGVGAVVNKPDAITPSASGTDVNSSDAISRVMSGKGTSDDFGDLLASYAK